jgi:hypothetical protein
MRFDSRGPEIGENWRALTVRGIAIFRGGDRVCTAILVIGYSIER